jgi:hypothetical protein
MSLSLLTLVRELATCAHPGVDEAEILGGDLFVATCTHCGARANYYRHQAATPAQWEMPWKRPGLVEQLDEARAYEPAEPADKRARVALLVRLLGARFAPGEIETALRLSDCLHCKDCKCTER